jgi:hypothetical protein
VYHVLNSSQLAVRRFVIVLVVVLVLVLERVIRPSVLEFVVSIIWKEKGDMHGAPLFVRPTRSWLPFGRRWVFLLVTRNPWSFHNERSSSKQQTSTATLEDDDENDGDRQLPTANGKPPTAN